jgi:lipopolysaccharide transport system ATP-binding protein
MSSNEISRKFDEIIAFAEVEKFIHTPVKYYSSGMYMRLAFAVAAHLEPEILLIDEVLAVGDASFQKKCLGKMGEVAKEGRTILFVSHNIGAVKSVCARGILLNEGHLIYMDSIENVINKYLTNTFLHSKQVISGTKELKLIEFKINKNDQSVNAFNTFDNITFDIAYDASIDLSDVTIAICFNNLHNTRITSLWTKYINQSFNLKKGRNSFKINVQRIKLIPGMYEIILYAERKGLTLERIDKFKQIVVGAPELYSSDQIINSDQGLYLEEFSVENV